MWAISFSKKLWWWPRGITQTLPAALRCAVWAPFAWGRVRVAGGGNGTGNGAEAGPKRCPERPGAQRGLQWDVLVVLVLQESMPGVLPPFQPLAHTPGTKTRGDPVWLPPELEGERAQREEEEEEG